ncbi:hypothetical protein [Rhizobium laguerreae]|uniref:hypothetical protein n=1 Tax=Rhizobium laguerreae TaxID=1076926 RepID=UPI001C90BE91|nr:hypothetical protein [Rhizobium laguerreae]MBY3138980.1 hypothetical protein [Rhizobium laguerreae]
MITREELYELVWSTPGWRAAPAFDVTESYLIRVCRRLDVPRPSRGYWAKSEPARALERRPLPPAGPGIPRFWSKSTRPPRPRPPRDEPRATSRPKKDRGPKHPLIADAELHFQQAELGPDGDYLKPRKKLVVDVTASGSGLAKCLAFADRLFRTLEGRGYRVVIAPTFELSRAALDPRQGTPACALWSPWRPTVVFVHTMPIGLAVAEIGETVEVQYAGYGNFIAKEEFERKKRFGPTWKGKRPVPCGRLKLTAYSPLNGFPWSREWSETAGTALDDGLEQIAAAIESGALELLAMLERSGR